MQADRKIVNRTKLKKIIASERQAGKKIVFTNGCFDILHGGHLHLFEKAKSFGDILIIGLNTDASVKILKGRDRPIMPERDRARLLAALEVVDYVVLFDEETPYEILKCLQPDILVKGEDYQFNEIVGSDIIPEVKRVPLVKGKSTTKIISRIHSAQK